MGGGGLRILGHKSWHVWKRDNIERVERDEAQHRQRLASEDAERQARAQEQRWELLHQVAAADTTASSSSSSRKKHLNLFSKEEREAGAADDVGRRADDRRRPAGHPPAAQPWYLYAKGTAPAIDHRWGNVTRSRSSSGPPTESDDNEMIRRSRRRRRRTSVDDDPLVHIHHQLGYAAPDEEEDVRTTTTRHNKRCSSRGSRSPPEEQRKRPWRCIRDQRDTSILSTYDDAPMMVHRQQEPPLEDHRTEAHSSDRDALSRARRKRESIERERVARLLSRTTR